MITKTRKADLGPGLPEKKKKKKVVKEPETQYSILNNDDYFANVSPIRATSPSKSVVHGKAPEMPLKKKGVSTLCEEHVEPDTTPRARRPEKSPSPRQQVLFLCGEKKKKSPPAMSHASGVKTSPDPRQGEEETRVGKKLKKHKKETKGAQDPTALSVQNRWFCEAGDAADTCSVGKKGEEQAALGQITEAEEPQGAQWEGEEEEEKKKIHQEGDALPGHSKPSRSMESSPRKGRKKKPKFRLRNTSIPKGDGPKAPAKKKMKSKKVEQPIIEELALKRKKKNKRQESGAARDPWKEETDTDLEVVLEKKGNIDQVRRKALQGEMDRELGKTKFGQWDTAGFENEEQKLKFFKLTGGFKNLSPSFSPLNKKAADSLQQNLQQDCDRAMSWKYSRGAGLCFSTAPNKIFYIHRNASKLVKLED
uniref:Small acidic protein-like domain-containing protein n=1 Tax=Nomascus leucogenys TaxID=61853 RepID=A0A2I3GP79_NOMLE